MTCLYFNSHAFEWKIRIQKENSKLYFLFILHCVYKFKFLYSIDLWKDSLDENVTLKICEQYKE